MPRYLELNYFDVSMHPTIDNLILPEIDLHIDQNRIEELFFSDAFQKPWENVSLDGFSFGDSIFITNFKNETNKFKEIQILKEISSQDCRRKEINKISCSSSFSPNFNDLKSDEVNFFDMIFDETSIPEKSLDIKVEQSLEFNNIISSFTSNEFYSNSIPNTSRVNSDPLKEFLRRSNVATKITTKNTEFSEDIVVKSLNVTCLPADDDIRFLETNSRTDKQNKLNFHKNFTTFFDIVWKSSIESQIRVEHKVARSEILSEEACKFPCIKVAVIQPNQHMYPKKSSQKIELSPVPTTVDEQALILPSSSKKLQLSSPEFLDTPKKIKFSKINVKKKEIILELLDCQKYAISFLYKILNPLLTRVQSIDEFSSEKILLCKDYSVLCKKLHLISANQCTRNGNEAEKLMLSVKCLIKAIDIIISVHSTHALNYLKTQFKAYGDQLMYDHEKIIDGLVTVENKFFLTHCKVEWIVSEVEKILKFSTSKILIIINEGFEILSSILKTSFEKDDSISCDILTSEKYMSIGQVCIINHQILKMLPNHRVKDFEHIIEYCEVDYMLKWTTSLKTWVSLSVSKLELMTICLSPILHLMNSPDHSSNVIVTNKLMQNSDFLRLAESVYDIQFIERDYVVASGMYELDTPGVFADVILDEANCVIIEDMIVLENSISNQALKSLFTKIVGISLQTKACWLLIKLNYKSSCSIMTGIFQLLSQFDHNDFKVQILYFDDNNSLAKLLKNICQLVQSNEVSKQVLKQDCDLHELLLLQFPCINSFNAQVMLAKVQLQELLTLSKSQLLESFDNVPKKVLLLFHDLTNQTSAMYDQMSFSPDLAVKDTIPLSVSPLTGALKKDGVELEMSINEDKHGSLAFEKSFSHHQSPKLKGSKTALNEITSPDCNITKMYFSPLHENDSPPLELSDNDNVNCNSSKEYGISLTDYNIAKKYIRPLYRGQKNDSPPIELVDDDFDRCKSRNKCENYSILLELGEDEDERLKFKNEYSISSAGYSIIGKNISPYFGGESKARNENGETYKREKRIKRLKCERSSSSSQMTLAFV